jgi:hypothetical protein
LQNFVAAVAMAAAILCAVWNEGRAHPLAEAEERLLSDHLRLHQEAIPENVQAQSWRWLPLWVDKARRRQDHMRATATI